MVATAFFVTSLFAVAWGNPLGRRAMHVHESRSAAPVGFVKGGAAPADTVMTMLIALTQNNPAGLEKAVMDVSTPGNALYGQHLTKEQVSRVVLFISIRD